MDLEPLIAFSVEGPCAEEDEISFVCQVYTLMIDVVKYPDVGSPLDHFSGALQAASAEATLS